MVNCPECDSVLDVEEEELDEGDQLTCEECGATLAVTSTAPLELEAASDEGGDEDDDEDFEDFDEDDEDEDEEEEDDEDY